MTENDTTENTDAGCGDGDSRLHTIAAQQRNILSALGMILDTLRAQGKMLQQLTAFAREEPASSPLVQSLDDLTGAIVNMDRSLEAMAGQIEILPQAIAAELARPSRAPDGGGDG